MKKLKLCNVHKLALSNEGEGRKPIHIPFGTWSYDDTIDQTLDREHAEKIAADLAGKVAAGEPGIPVYQGHPDVPEYASKYPDKGALGWIKRILVNEDGMDLEVEWDRDPGKGFGWFSPFWTGDDPGTGATGKRNVIVDGLTSVGLVNNPNIREFRLANEAGENLTRRGGGAEVSAFKLPQRIIDLANEYDESKHPRAEDGKWTSGGSAAALSAAQAEFDTAKSELIAGQKRGWSKEENDRAFRRYDRAEKKLKEAKDHDKMIRASSGPGRTKQPSNIKDSDMIPHPVLKQQETKKKLDALWAELGRRFDDRMASRPKGR